MKNHETQPGTMKNQPGTMKNHVSRTFYVLLLGKVIIFRYRHFSSVTRGHNWPFRCLDVLFQFSTRPRSANAITWHPAPGGRKGEEDTLSLPGSRAVATPVLSLSHKAPPAANMPQSQKAAPPKNLHLPLPPSPSPKLSPKSPAKKSRSPNLLKKVQAVKTGLQFVNSLSPDSKTPH